MKTTGAILVSVTRNLNKVAKKQNHKQVICQHQMQTFTKCWQTNLYAAWHRDSWIHYCLHLILPWSCSPSQTFWLCTELGFDSHVGFCLECAKLLSTQESSGTGKLNWDMGRVTCYGWQCRCSCLKPPGSVNSNLNSSPRNQSSIDRAKAIPTEFYWLLIKHVIWSASRL